MLYRVGRSSPQQQGWQRLAQTHEMLLKTLARKTGSGCGKTSTPT
jgi:hypothetical protein